MSIRHSDEHKSDDDGDDDDDDDDDDNHFIPGLKRHCNRPPVWRDGAAGKLADALGVKVKDLL